MQALLSGRAPRLAFGDQLWIIDVISGSIDVYSAKSLSLIRQFDLGSPAMTFDPFEFKARLHEIDATDFSVRSSQPFPGFLPDARQIATVASAFGQVLFDFDLFCAVDGINLPNSSSMGIDPAPIAGLVDPSSGQGTEANPAAGVLVESVRGLYSDGRGFKTEMKTDSLGAATQLKDALGNVTTMQRDGDSLPIKVINARGAETDLAYAASGNLEQVKELVKTITDASNGLCPWECSRPWSMILRET